MIVTPLSDRVLIKRKQQEQIRKGILLVESKPAKHDIGEVISCGPETKSVKVGNQVLIDKYCGQDIEIDGESFCVVSEKEIIAIVQEEVEDATKPW